jgi:hypothetical protein
MAETTYAMTGMPKMMCAMTGMPKTICAITGRLEMMRMLHVKVMSEQAKGTSKIHKLASSSSFSTLSSWVRDEVGCLARSSEHKRKRDSGRFLSLFLRVNGISAVVGV